MLQHDEAEQAIKQLRQPAWLGEVNRRAGRLPKPVSEAVRKAGGLIPARRRPPDTIRILDILDDNPLDLQAATEQARAEAVAALDALDPAARQAAFAAVFPKLGPTIEATWQRMKAEPYATGYQIVPFRCPHEPNVTTDARGQWFTAICHQLRSLDVDAVWLAAWTPYLSRWGISDQVGRLLASAIDLGGETGEQVYQTLIDSANGEHEIGTMGRHVMRALLSSSREDGWTFIEKLLLAAQRQEGLRQTILETCDLAHPEAFRRMLRLILDENLVRFASVARAADCWFALQWDSSATGAVKQAIEHAACFLEDDTARAAALAGEKADELFMALWATAFQDAEQAVPTAARLLDHDNVEVRFTGAWMLRLLGLNTSVAALVPALDDEDLRVAGVALTTLRHASVDEVRTPETFARFQRLIERTPKKAVQGKPLLWPWLTVKLARADVADTMAACLGDDAWPRLVKYVPMMSPHGRASFVTALRGRKQWPAGTRELLLALVGDASGTVREAAIKLLEKEGVEPGEAKTLEALLTRKAGDLRRGVLVLLRKLPDEAVLASTDRLLASSHKLQRLAGLEQLTQLSQRKTTADACRERARRYADAHDPLGEDERALIAPLLGDRVQRPTLKDGLGLFDPARLTPPRPLHARDTKLASPAALGLLTSLDDFVHAHRETPMTIERSWGDNEQTLLGNAQYCLTGAAMLGLAGEAEPAFPLADLWSEWDEQRSAELRDEDGLELVRAAALTSLINWRGTFEDRGDLLTTFITAATPPAKAGGLVQNVLDWLHARRRSGNVPPPEFKYGRVVTDVVVWLVRRQHPAGLVDFLLDAAETALAAVPEKLAVRWLRGSESLYTVWLRLAEQHHRRAPAAWNDEQTRRLVMLLQWFDQPVNAKGQLLIADDAVSAENKRRQQLAGEYHPAVHRRAPLSVDALGEGLRLDVLNEHDVLAGLISEQVGGRAFHQTRPYYDGLRELTGRSLHPAIKTCPRLGELVDRARQRIVEVELMRGDEPTAATDAALAIRCLPGSNHLLRLLQAMGRTTFLRGYTYSGGRDRKTVFSHLIRVSVPAEDDTAEAFAKAARQTDITEKRWIETAVFAPQWAKLIEQTLGWNGLEDAVWWIHAHTRDDQWSVGNEIREAWASEVAERTELTSEELLGGAVDVRWFERAYERLGKKRWQQVHGAAKNASSAGGHKRAQLYADAMLGQLTKTELAKRIEEKRHKEAVQALGLLPLARGNRREKDLLDRYERMQQFIRTSRQFGQQRQASEKRAAEIGQTNLARTAGYRDPLRLQWAMEAKAVEDLAAGPVTVTAGETTVTLAITDTGEPTLTIAKSGRTLKALPAAAKKDKRIVALRDRRTHLKRQASRMRLSLEQMMCKAELFAGDELAELMAHPLMRPMLERVVVLGEGVAGYPAKGGKLLVDHAGHAEPVKHGEQLRLAHPHDLLKRGDWSAWQSDCFAGERVQPFKQVFRELYVLTDTERNDGTFSARYAGQQVNPRQAVALLGTRGWVVRPEEGVRRTFHDHQLSAWLAFQEHFHTPAEVDGLTLEHVRFSKAGEWKPVPLEAVPPLVFSEVMRDMDLVVSVAHRGGVDPEASASTIDMRADLLRETLAVLAVENVRIEHNHALVEGGHARYSVHLGSAVTHVMPGGSLFIVPVHSQHRGRLFLPFADDDPKTAEVLSKVLLLARDREIKDPNILDQIRTLT
ncbi:MAG: DUF5724 domain-containing protein [Phycisphaeraceae bacterium]